MLSVCSRGRLASTSRMMFTRVAPLRLRLSLMGSRTLVARTISLLTPFKALPTRVSLSPRLYTSAVSMKLMPLSRASFTIRVVSSWPRLPMFILPPNCIVPSATSLTMRPVFPSFLCFISHSSRSPGRRVDLVCQNWALTEWPVDAPKAVVSMHIRFCPLHSEPMKGNDAARVSGFCRLRVRPPDDKAVSARHCFHERRVLSRSRGRDENSVRAGAERCAHIVLADAVRGQVDRKAAGLAGLRARVGLAVQSAQERTQEQD